MGDGAYKESTRTPFSVPYLYKLYLPPTRPPAASNMANLDSNITQLESGIDYIFRDKLLAAEAIQMAAKVAVLYVNGNYHEIRKNDRLAIVGDSILDSMLSIEWYKAKGGRGINTLFAYEDES